MNIKLDVHNADEFGWRPEADFIHSNDKIFRLEALIQGKHSLNHVGEMNF